MKQLALQINIDSKKKIQEKNEEKYEKIYAKMRIWEKNTWIFSSHFECLKLGTVEIISMWTLF